MKGFCKPKSLENMIEEDFLEVKLEIKENVGAPIFKLH
jgi:hypothetical protein